MLEHISYVIINYISVAIMVACCVIIATHKGSKMSKYALLVCFSLTICCIGFLFKSEATDVHELILGQKLVYAFVTHGMFLMLLFIFEYCNFKVPVFVRWIFHGINFLVSFTVLTLDYHNFFYKDYWTVERDGAVILEKDYGFMHTVAVALFAFYMAVSVIATFVFSFKNMKKRKKYVWRILIAVMIPCVSYIIPKLTDSNNDLQPLAFAVFSLIVLYMIYENNLYDIDGIVFRYSVASASEAIIVLDEKNNFKGCNEIAKVFFPVLTNVELDSDIQKEAPELNNIVIGKVNEYNEDGKIYSVKVKPIIENSGVQGKVIRVTDITDERTYTDFLQANKEKLELQVDKLFKFSYMDELTGLQNRRSYEDAVNEIRKSGTVKDITVASCDLDGLKRINDNIGHAAGDELIIGAARILEKVYSKYGTVYRTGGDEFVIIMKSASGMLGTLNSEFEKEQLKWKGAFSEEMSICCGFAVGDENPRASIDQLLILADKEMYILKNHRHEKTN